MTEFNLSKEREKSGLKLGASGLVHPALITFLEEIDKQDKEFIKRVDKLIGNFDSFIRGTYIKSPVKMRFLEDIEKLKDEFGKLAGKKLCAVDNKGERK